MTLTKQKKSWTKFHKSPEMKAFEKFQKEVYKFLYKKYGCEYTGNHPFGAENFLEKGLTKIPLIGVEEKKLFFESRDHYDNPFFIFDKNTLPIKKISIKEARTKSLNFVGNIHGIPWGLGEVPGHSSSSYRFYGDKELFTRLGNFFQKNKIESPPNYFLLELSGKIKYNPPKNVSWVFEQDSPVYCLTLFKEMEK